ncbi:MAG TPA: PKD domain-containing protein [Ohtaekwangia sp.]|uniref:PKD domain-containing protein n=1 Tax=Ohtaekwangia sp. TaxID=2066019 RepID=UPI002F938F21
MKAKLYLLFSVWCGLLVTPGYAQSITPVDMFTGAASADIPIWTVTDHDLQMPLRLSYNPNNIKTSDDDYYGLGWELAGLPSISRELRGLPDDYGGSATDNRRGWLYKNSANVGVGADMMFFVSAATDSLSSTCTDETAVYNKISGYMYTIDTEVDIFSYSCGNVSGRFVFDNADPNTIRLIPYRDVKIEVTTASATDKTITAFKITTNDGVSYTFNQLETMQLWTTKLNGINSVETLKRDFEYFDVAKYPSRFTYTYGWRLSRIDSPSGAFITVTYTDKAFNNGFVGSTTKFPRPNIDTVRTVSPVDGSVKQEYVNNVAYIKKYFKSASTSLGNSLSVRDYTGGGGGIDLSRIFTIMDDRRSASAVKTVSLNYVNVLRENKSVGSPVRFLVSAKEESTCDKFPPYQFTYKGVDPINKASSIPAITTKGLDFWGYYNGKNNQSLYPTIYVFPNLAPAERYRLYPIPGYSGTVVTLNGADRTPDEQAMQTGVLESMTYPHGGSLSLVFEANRYYDAVSNQSYIGGGLRIKGITLYDGLNSNGITQQNFTYEESAGKTSGRLLVKPSFAIPLFLYSNTDSATPTTRTYSSLVSGPASDLWKYLTAVSSNDLYSNETIKGSVVGYRVSMMAQPGAGSTRYQYSLPAYYGESSSGTWQPTIVKIARSANCPIMGVMSTGGKFLFPYVRNANLDQDAGLLLTMTEFKDGGIKVRETSYTYQSVYKPGITSPYKVWGMKYDKFPYSTDPVFLYGVYAYQTDFDKALQTETVVTPNPANQSASLTTSTSYFYESSYHALLTKVQVMNSDSTIYTTKYKYPQDYGAIPGNADKTLQMITRLQAQFRNGIVIEQVKTMKRTGDVEKVVDGTVRKFDDFQMSNAALEKEVCSLNLAAGKSNFVFSDKALQGSTYVFKMDSLYETVQYTKAYDTYHMPITVVGKDSIPVTTSWGLVKSLPVVTVSNADVNTFAFSNFETNPVETNVVSDFQLTYTAAWGTTGGGRTGTAALYPNFILTKTLQKANASNYKLSFWLKKQSGAVSFRITVMNTAKTTTYYDNTFSVTPAGSDFEYFEKSIPIASFPSSFVVIFQGLLTGTGSLPLVDDVAFYPENSELTSYTYDVPFGVNSITDSRGVTQYMQYDGLGRITMVQDQDRNIIKRYNYTFTSIPVSSLYAHINNDPHVMLYDYTSYAFTAGSNCVDGVTYTWDFGGGNIRHGQTVNYSFTNTGNTSVTLTVSHPLYPTATVSVVYNVQLKTLQVSSCIKGRTSYDFCTEAVSTVNCTSITSTPATNLTTIFRVTGTDIPGNETITSYQWKYKKPTDTVWTNYATTQETTAAAAETRIYQCEVTTNTGRKGLSIPYQIDFVRPAGGKSCP